MTGTGETLGPFNPRSLVRAFLVGGAEEVVASRWNVDGAATAELMRAFYHGLADGKPAAEALAEAQRALLYRPSMRRPYYWAAFSIFSNP
jgi:CHAT domain-containing protein